MSNSNDQTISTPETREREVARLRAEIAQRKGWQKCPTHGEINADHHWGCPDCVRELRAEVDEHKRWRAKLADDLHDRESQIADLTAQLAAMTQERDEAVKTRVGYDEWLRGGVYFTTEEYERHIEHHKQQLAASEARAKELEAARQTMRDVNDHDAKYQSELEARVTALTSALVSNNWALAAWMHTYASDLCDAAQVKMFRQFIEENGGTLAYIAKLIAHNKALTPPAAAQEDKP